MFGTNQAAYLEVATGERLQDADVWKFREWKLEVGC
jgi:hypothetical protein